MKSVKLFLGMMLCLVVLAGQAQAATSLIDFEKVWNFNSLNDYGASTFPTLTFSDDWGRADLGGNSFATEFKFLNSDLATVTFGTIVNLLSFDYSFTGFPEAKVYAYDNNGDQIFSDFLSISETFTTFTLLNITGIKSLAFEISQLGGGAIRLDNIASSPVPLPGAAILLGSGLLGLIGLRRREII